MEGAGIFLCVWLFLGQTMALVDYEFTISLGLQEAASAVTDIGVAYNKAFGVADTLFYLPLLVIGLVGYGLGKTWGVVPLAAALGITAYWPIVCLYALYAAKGAPGFTFSSHMLYTIILVPVAAYGLWGLAFLYWTEIGRRRSYGK